MTASFPSWCRIATLVRSVVGFKAVWLCTVLGAAAGDVWLGPLALLAFAGVQTFLSKNRRRELLVLASGLAMGLVMETVVVRAEWVNYAPGWPDSILAPAWILALWGAFSLMSIDGLAWLRGRRVLAALLGATGAPFAYLSGIVLGAGSEAGVAFFVTVGLFYAAATPLLVELGGRLGERRGRPRGEEESGGDLTLFLGLGGRSLGRGEPGTGRRLFCETGLAAQDGRESGQGGDECDRKQYGLTDDAQTAGASS